MFTFSGNWSIELQLSQLAQLKSDRFFQYATRSHHRERLNAGFVPVQIYDEETEDPDPREEQIKCIDWITEHQPEILQTLFMSLTKKIFPYYVRLWEDDPNDERRYPKLNSPDALPLAIGMDSIGIHFDHKENLSYYTMYFSFSTDEEHGLALILHKSRLIGFGAIGDTDNQKIIEDLGLNYEEWINQRLAQKKKNEPKLHTPHAKYGKLKPWQQRDNDYFPFGLLHANRYADLVNYLHANPAVRSENLEALIDIAEYHKKDQLVEMLRGL